MTAQNTCDSIADFIASMNPQKVIELHASLSFAKILLIFIID